MAVVLECAVVYVAVLRPRATPPDAVPEAPPDDVAEAPPDLVASVREREPV
jgi:hypothetical protein